MSMEFEWDEAKNEANKLKHGLDFAALDKFVWETAVIIPDRRRDYGEPRFLAYGLIGERLYVVVFTKRNGRIRIIGACKANARERGMFYEDVTET